MHVIKGKCLVNLLPFPYVRLLQMFKGCISHFDNLTTEPSRIRLWDPGSLRGCRNLRLAPLVTRRSGYRTANKNGALKDLGT